MVIKYIIAILIIFVSVNVYGNDHYIATTGDDVLGAGTEGDPWATPTKGLAEASGGDIIHLADGVYTDHDNDNYVLWINKSGSAGNLITFRSTNKYGAVFTENSGYDHGVGFNGDVGVSMHHIRFEGIAFTGNGGNGVFNNAGADDIEFYQCKSNNNDWDGFYISGGGYTDPFRFLIDTCEIYSNGADSSGQIHGIYMKGGGDHVVKNCLFWDHTSGYAIHLYGADMTSVDIYNCTFAHQAQDPGGPLEGHIEAWCDITGTLTIRNCISFDSYVAFIEFRKSNIFNAVVIENCLMDVASLYRLYDPPPGGYPDSNVTDGLTESGNVPGVDPELTDTVGPDYDWKLISGSPCEEAGTSTGAPSVDFDGNARPRCDYFDIGAYESQLNVCPGAGSGTTGVSQPAALAGTLP